MSPDAGMFLAKYKRYKNTLVLEMGGIDKLDGEPF